MPYELLRDTHQQRPCIVVLDSKIDSIHKPDNQEK